MTETNTKLHDILTGINGGNEDSFNTFYDAYYDRIYKHIFIRTSYDEHTTKDIVQQVMLKVVKYVKPVNSENELWKWLVLVCRSTLADEYRKRTKLKETPFDEDISNSDPLENPPELLYALDLALPTLSEPENDLLDNFYFKKISYNNLAEKYECTSKAIEMRLSKIRQKLKTLIVGTLHNGK